MRGEIKRELDANSRSQTPLRKHSIQIVPYYDQQIQGTEYVASDRERGVVK